MNSIIDTFPIDAQKDCLRRVLRTRRRIFPIVFNGITHFVWRSELRDHLRAKYPDVHNKRAAA